MKKIAALVLVLVVAMPAAAQAKVVGTATGPDVDTLAPKIYDPRDIKAVATHVSEDPQGDILMSWDVSFCRRNGEKVGVDGPHDFGEWWTVQSGEIRKIPIGARWDMCRNLRVFAKDADFPGDVALELKVTGKFSAIRQDGDGD